MSTANIRVDAATFERSELPSLDRIMQGYVQPSLLPGYMRIIATDVCNQECIFCHNEGDTLRENDKIAKDTDNDPRSNNARIDEKIMWKAITASLSLGKNKFTFTGGEPTLNPDLSRFILTLREMEPEAIIGLVTNGSRLDTLDTEVFDHGLSHLTVSLPSCDTETLKSIVGNNQNYCRTMKGLNRARDYGMSDIRINMVITKHNFGEIERMADFAKEKGYLLKLLDVLPDTRYIVPYTIPNGEIKARVKAILSIRPELSEYLTVKPKPFHLKCKSCSYVPFCGEGEYLRLTINGELHPCIYKIDLSLKLDHDDSPETAMRKVALGYRRVNRGDL